MPRHTNKVEQPEVKEEVQTPLETPMEDLEPPVEDVPVECFIVVPSARVSHRTVTKPGVGTVKVAYGSVNGNPFEVECDTQVAVSPEIAEVLRHAIARG